jgi:hypothetical protein
MTAVAIQPLIILGTERLSQPAERVERFGTPELYQLIEDMRDTMQACKGVGIAENNLTIIFIKFAKLSTRFQGFLSALRYQETFLPLKSRQLLDRWALFRRAPIFPRYVKGRAA